MSSLRTVNSTNAIGSHDRQGLVNIVWEPQLVGGGHDEAAKSVGATIPSASLHMLPRPNALGHTPEPTVRSRWDRPLT